MEHVETYKGVKIFFNTRTTFYKTGVMSSDCSSLEFLKKLIDIKQAKN